MNDAKMWELNLPPDVDFINKYPTLVQEQSVFWKENENIFIDMDNRQNVKPPTMSEEFELPLIKKRNKSTPSKLIAKSNRTRRISGNASKIVKVKPTKKITPSGKR